MRHVGRNNDGTTTEADWRDIGVKVDNGLRPTQQCKDKRANNVLYLPAQAKAILEAVQKKAVHKVSGLTSSNYDGRLKELNLLSLEKRRESFDLVQTFKIVRKCDDVELAGDSPARITRHTKDLMKIGHPQPRPG